MQHHHIHPKQHVKHSHATHPRSYEWMGNYTMTKLTGPSSPSSMPDANSGSVFNEEEVSAIARLVDTLLELDVISVSPYLSPSVYLCLYLCLYLYLYLCLCLDLLSVSALSLCL